MKCLWQYWLYGVVEPTRSLGKWINSLPPGRCSCRSKCVIFKDDLIIGAFNISNKMTVRWMPQDLIGDRLKLVHVMAWCRQALSHNLNQCWPSSVMWYDISRVQWVYMNSIDWCGHCITVDIFIFLNTNTHPVTGLTHINHILHIYDLFGCSQLPRDKELIFFFMLK